MTDRRPPPGERTGGASPADHREAGLSDERLFELYRTMILVRAVDERLWITSRQGKAHFVLTSRGHVAAQIGSAAALRAGNDYVFTYYRSMAAALTLGVTPLDIMLSVFARAADPFSGGRQLPNHFSCPGLRMPTGSSSVGSHIPHAVGAAYAARVLDSDWVAVAYFGDGATSKGDFHEALNFAAVWKLPVVFVCENNGWAISVPLEKQMAVPVDQRGAGCGVPGVAVDGSDLLAVYSVAARAVERARGGQGPTLIDARVERLVPHSSDDDDRYRDPELVRQAQRRDPLPRLRAYLEQAGLLDQAAEERLWEEARSTALQAQEQAEAMPPAAVEDARTHLYHAGRHA